jgi:hypothetical protein
VESIAANRNITGAALDDLHACLDLMESTADLDFDWDMTLYNTHNAVLPGRPQSVRRPSLDGLLEQGAVSADSDDDELRDEDVCDQDEEHKAVSDERRRLEAEFDDVKDASKPPDLDNFVPVELLIGDVYLVRMEGIEWGLAR